MFNYIALWKLQIVKGSLRLERGAKTKTKKKYRDIYQRRAHEQVSEIWHFTHGCLIDVSSSNFTEALMSKKG